jgi:hypothetical protein
LPFTLLIDHRYIGLVNVNYSKAPKRIKIILRKALFKSNCIIFHH